MKKISFILFTILSLNANTQNWSEKMAATAMHTWKDSFAVAGNQAKWTYDMGVVLKGIEGLWTKTGDPKYLHYIQDQLNYFVGNDGSINGYRSDEFKLDDINNGKLLLFLYTVTGNVKYWKAASLLREQLRQQPRTSEGGFFHKKIYPHQMWLDGLYMAEPFYAAYARIAEDSAAYADIANQFILIAAHTRDSVTGLLYHAWDESKQETWANTVTGCSPHIWARAMGWYADALVDVLDYFPENHPQQKSLIRILDTVIYAIAKVQDPKTGLWLDVLDVKEEPANYFEASASCQFVYAIAKAIRKGYIQDSSITIAQKGYAGILSNFIKEENGQTNLYGTVKVSGLGGNPYRDGSFKYYMSEPVIVNDAKGIGAFILASNEMELLKGTNFNSAR